MAALSPRKGESVLARWRPSVAMGEPVLASAWASLPDLWAQPGHFSRLEGKEGGQVQVFPSVRLGTSDTKEATEVEKNGMPRVGSS